jgi:hypothetical protein
VSTQLGELKTAIALSHTLDRLPETAKVVIEVAGHVFLPVKSMRSTQLEDGSWAFCVSTEEYNGEDA